MAPIAIFLRLHTGNYLAAIGAIILLSSVGLILHYNKRVQVISINEDSIDLTEFFLGTMTIWAEDISRVEKKTRIDGPFYEIIIGKKTYRLDDVHIADIEDFIKRNNLKLTVVSTKKNNEAAI